MILVLFDLVSLVSDPWFLIVALVSDRSFSPGGEGWGEWGEFDGGGGGCGEGGGCEK